MTLCTENVAVNRGVAGARAVTLFCNSWSCDICAPRRRKRLIASIISGKPERFITLTIRPTPGRTAVQDARFMALSHRQFFQAIRWTFPKTDWQYFSVFEAHKSGRPHLHAATRGCYVNILWLRAVWEHITGSNGVRIDFIKHGQKVAAYVAKYMGKDAHRFGFCKRYWHSKNWELEPPAERKQEPGWSDFWEQRSMTLRQLAQMWTGMGWLLWQVEGTLYGGPDPPAGAKLISPEDVGL